MDFILKNMLKYMIEEKKKELEKPSLLFERLNNPSKSGGLITFSRYKDDTKEVQSDEI